MGTILGNGWSEHTPEGEDADGRAAPEIDPPWAAFN